MQSHVVSNRFIFCGTQHRNLHQSDVTPSTVTYLILTDLVISACSVCQSDVTTSTVTYLILTDLVISACSLCQYSKLLQPKQTQVKGREKRWREKKWK